MISLSLVAIALAVWEGLARTGKLSKIIFPAPTLIIQSLWNGLLDGKFTEDLQISATRIILGFLIGGGSGLVLGLLMGWSRRLRGIFDPIIAALHPIPKFALLPMIIIFFGLGESSRIAMVSIGTFFPMVVNAMTGVLQINPIYYEVMENYGASRFDIFRRVVFPGSLPFALSGARLSLRSSLTITIGVEMVFGNTGLGSKLWLAWETMRLVDMYSILLIVAIIGVGMLSLLERTKKYLIPWHHENFRDG
jgi:NitT/TauT family transport system permease protein